jgi:hypothetical protein
VLLGSINSSSSVGNRNPVVQLAVRRITEAGGGHLFHCYAALSSIYGPNIGVKTNSPYFLVLESFTYCRRVKNSR